MFLVVPKEIRTSLDIIWHIFMYVCIVCIYLYDSCEWLFLFVISMLKYIALILRNLVMFLQDFSHSSKIGILKKW